MKKAFHSLFRKGEANVIKILCLGIGLAIGLTLIAEVLFERSYDDFVPAKERTYRVGESYQRTGEEPHDYHQTPGAWGPSFQAESPGIEAATRFTNISDMTLQTEDNRSFYGRAWLADSCFFDLFPRRLLMGEAPEKGLGRPGCAYISDKMLAAVGTDILGKSVRWKTYPQFTITVVGVFEAFPENTNLPEMDILVSMPTIGQVMWDGSQNWLGNDRYKTFIRLRPNADLNTVKEDARRTLLKHFPLEEQRKAGLELRISFLPIGDLYTSSDYHRLMNIVFLAFGLLMLAVAVLNYILLTISSMVKRAKSIATYRCYGADSRDIYRLILSESLLHGLLSLALAVLIVFGLQDFLQEQLGHSLKSLFTAATLTVCFLMTLAVILVCGVLPGWLYTRIPVTYAYRRYSESKRQWKLGLLSAQFLLTTFFVSLLAVIGSEYHLLTNYTTGFDYQQLLYVSTRGCSVSERTTCLQELKKLPCVERVTYGYQEMWEHCSGNNVLDKETGHEYMNIADMYVAGDDYHATFGIPIVEGRAFTPHLRDTLNQEIMVSRSFVQRMEKLAGWTGSPIGREVFLTGHDHQGIAPRLTICGVFEDIRIGSQIAEDADERPQVLFYNPTPSYLFYIRMRELSPETMQQVQEVVNHCVQHPEDHIVKSVGIEMGRQYDSVKLIRNSVLFAGLCILFIALIGLVAYIRDEVSRRRSEMAIRIIHGASMADVQRLFQRDLLRIAVPATLLGAIVAWNVSGRLLEMFAVKIDLTALLFGGCTLAVLAVIAGLSITLVLKAARSNPTDNLRNE